jgi:hypothetical protein
VRKLKRGSGKYKGKLSFKCRLGHFFVECPYAKREDNDEEEHNNKIKPYKHKRGKYTEKKSFYSREDNISSKESDGYVFEIDKEEFLFMSMDTKYTNTENEDNKKEKSNLEEEDIDGEVNLEA